MNLLGKTVFEEDAERLPLSAVFNADGVILIRIQDQVGGFIDPMKAAAGVVECLAPGERLDRKASGSRPEVAPGSAFVKDETERTQGILISHARFGPDLFGFQRDEHLFEREFRLASGQPNAFHVREHIPLGAQFTKVESLYVSLWFSQFARSPAIIDRRYCVDGGNFSKLSSDHLRGVFLMKTNMAFLLAVVLIGAAVPVLSHHSFTAEYDGSKPVNVTGTVTKVEWTNPHIWFYVDVKDENGKVTSWAFSAGPPGVLQRRGITKEVLKIGDVVKVDGFRARDGSNNASGGTVTFADGRRVFTASAEDRVPNDKKK